MKQTTFFLSFIILSSFLVESGCKSKTTGVPELAFKHHFIDLTLPMNDQGYGDYGMTALVDIDKDGKLDFVLGGRTPAPSRLYWYQYLSANNWVRHEVGTDYMSDVALSAIDIDGDGWLDLVCSGVWYRNTGNPREEPFERIVFDEQGAGAHDVVAKDVNGDGKQDIVVMGDEKTPLNGIYWYDIPSDPRQPWTKHYIGEGIHGAFMPDGLADINGDGFIDVVRADTWFQNKDGKGIEWIAHSNIPMGRKGPFGCCVRTVIADMDNNKKPVIVMCDADIEDSKIVILRNPDGKGESWVKQELPQSFTYGSLHALAVADFNGDKLLDIVAIEQEELLPEDRQNPRCVVWLNNGNGSYTENIILDRKLGGHELQIGDVDGDGDIDICSKVWGACPWNGVDGKIHVDFLENISNE